ncbi:hypothetical protein [Carnobacterium divergens]|uniref:Phage protein n=1 Tax=Carnobacterium divergens TaxID=2748 RepID=A0AAW8R7X3_CARDV|nr:hypothetical protein [Carnobacterium divergens]MDT1957572.1 hypothetical protein [Carnobacterium divergens]MDT1973775.1 hypothetical protein [Carnobacterium divergens]MDT2011118.1 hypothetical protein [Carnobacterium divergens]
MTVRQIELLNGEKVLIDTSLSLAQLTRSQKEGLLSKTFLQDMVAADKDPSKMDFDGMFNAVYIAYKNKNKATCMPLDEFKELLPVDLEAYGEIYSEILNGKLKHHEMANQLQKAVSKSNKKNSGKKPVKNYRN